MGCFLWTPPVRRSEYIFDCIQGCLFRRKPVGEGGSFLWKRAAGICIGSAGGSAFPMAIIFSIIKVSMGLLPVMPAGGVDMCAQLTADKHGFCPFAPRASKVDGTARTVTCQTAVSEYVAEGNLLWRGGGCNIAVNFLVRGAFRRFPVVRQFGKQRTFFKKSGSASKDKIHVSLYKAAPV